MICFRTLNPGIWEAKDGTGTKNKPSKIDTQGEAKPQPKPRRMSKIDVPAECEANEGMTGTFAAAVESSAMLTQAFVNGFNQA